MVGDTWYYQYRHPTTKKKHGMGTDKFEAIQAANALNSRLIPQKDLFGRVMGVTQRRISQALDDFKTEFVDDRDYEQSTVSELMRRIRKFSDAMDAKEVVIVAINVETVSDYLDQFPIVERNRTRSALILLFQYFGSKGWATWNPAEATLPRKETVKRKRLTYKQYCAIYAAASVPIQNAMDLSLQTLQARNEISNMRFEHIKDGFLHVVRQKTKKKTSLAFLDIEVSEEIAKIVERCRSDNVLTHHLVHQTTGSNKRRFGKRLSPDSITRGFAAARDTLAEFQVMPEEARPTFHEVRSLGSMLYRKAGWVEEDIQKLLAHTSLAMTEKYLDGHEPEPVKCRSGLKL